MRSFPLATLALAALLVVAYGVELSAGVEGFALAHGFDPEHPTFGAALVSVFLHASLAHLAGNLLALVVLGAIVEAELGATGLFALFVAGGLAGCALHALLAPGCSSAARARSAGSRPSAPLLVRERRSPSSSSSSG